MTPPATPAIAPIVAVATGMATDFTACLPTPLTLDPESLMADAAPDPASLIADVASDPASLDAWLTRPRTPLAAARDAAEPPEPEALFGRCVPPREPRPELDFEAFGFADFALAVDLPFAADLVFAGVDLAVDLAFAGLVFAGVVFAVDLPLVADLPLAGDVA